MLRKLYIIVTVKNVQLLKCGVNTMEKNSDIDGE